MQQALILAVTCLLVLPASARVVWIPAEFEPNEKSAAIVARDTSGSCGDSFPSDFTCSGSTTCLHLNTTSSIKAVLCCPAGQDCSVIAPVSCDQSLQNATSNPGSMLHADPTTQLATCGSACCPMGYSCQGSSCYAQTAAAAAAPSLAASSSARSSSVASGITGPTAAGSLATSTSASQHTSEPTSANSTVPGTANSGFSGGSFAAGFVPGIFLGACLAACLLLCLLRKKDRSSSSYVNEKHSHRDTLTDLGTLSRRPTMHGRSISEPTVDPSASHRTDFLRNTPPRIPDGTTSQNSYTVEARGPMTPARTPKAVKALFSRSPFMTQTPSTPPATQPPLPYHLKRGTLSFTISPVRALKKQKSMHSLRRQMTDISRGSSRRRPDNSRSGSTETIQVLMPSNEPYTPDQRTIRPIAEDAPATLDSSVYRPHESSSTWRTTESGESSHSVQQPAPAAQYPSSSRYYSGHHITPTRPPGRASSSAGGGGSGAAGGRLGTPYTPSTYQGNGTSNGKTWVTDVLIGKDGGLKVIREPEKRDTTFSTMMERAGLRKSDLLMGSGNR